MTGQGVDDAGNPIMHDTIAPDPERAKAVAFGFTRGVRFGIRLGIRIAEHRRDRAEVRRLLVGTGLDIEELEL